MIADLWAGERDRCYSCCWALSCGEFNSITFKEMDEGMDEEINEEIDDNCVSNSSCVVISRAIYRLSSVFRPCKA
jgi:hypothetical protein